MPGILDVIEHALGSGPGTAAERPLSEADLWRVLSARSELGKYTTIAPKPTEVWPLVSHHGFGPLGVFGQGERELLPRVLTLLLRHDGLVIADPLEEARRAARLGKVEPAIAHLGNVIHELAALEPLIAAGVLRFTSARPALHDRSRQAVLDVFGIDSNFRVFTNFIEAAASTSAVSSSFEREYAPQVEDLLERFAIAPPKDRSLDSYVEAVQNLARALIEVSWQFAVCSRESTADLSVAGGLELHLARAVIDSIAPRDAVHGLGRTRHLERFSLGLVPNLRPGDLSVADALAIRSDDAFAQFRESLGAAIDDYERDIRSGCGEVVAQGAFEDRMSHASELLGRQARHASFGDRVSSASVPAAVGVCGELALAPLGSMPAASAVAAVSAATVVWEWINGRPRPGSRSSRRYCAMLAGRRSVL